ncbi:MAG: tetratricopeptide repeat protein [Spirochaetales bacterium]|nr:tetratricopeptide repeat protein [Spirochaetales bacterium]
MEDHDGKKVKDVIVELTKEGNSLLKHNRLDEAVGRFRLALEHDPENAYALSGLGDAARKRGDFSSARDYFSACLKAHPENNYALFGLGDCYRGLHDLPKAIETWRACLEHEPNDTTVLSSIGDAYRKLSDLHQAKAYYEEALKADPGCLHAIKGMGYLYYDLKMFPEGIAYWNDVLLRDERLSDDAEALAEAGNCHRRALEFVKALPFFERVLKLDPNGFPGNFGMADCLRGVGNFKGARLQYEKILEREPDNQSILTRAGDMCVNLGEFEAAAGYFDRTLEIGENLFARLGRAHILEKTGRYRDALRLLEDADQRYPRNPRVQREMKECRRKLRGDG